MPKPYDLAIFDNDGVLVDSEHVAVGIHVQVLATMGWQLTEEEVIDRFVGRSRAHMADALSAHLGYQLPANWDDRFTDLYRREFESELQPVPGVTAALDQIAIPTCVASGGSPDRLRSTLSRTRLLDRFQGRIFSASEVPNGKPAPDLFLHAAQSMGADPSRCAVIEDSVPGVEAAIAAGMDAFAFAGGVTSAASLSRTGVTVFNDMRELPALLRSRRPHPAPRSQRTISSRTQEHGARHRSLLMLGFEPPGSSERPNSSPIGSYTSRTSTPSNEPTS